MQIIRAFSALTLFLVAALTSNKLLCQIHLNEVMTLEQQKKTGVFQLSAQQKQELEKWLNEKFILKTSQSETPSLSIQQNLHNGSELQLSDGSIYAIAPTDQSKTSFWLTPAPITISPSGDPMFPVLLTNTLTGVSVRAKPIRPPAARTP